MADMGKQKHVRFDWAAKKILRSKANFGILEGFLSELLKEDVKILEVLESEGNKESPDDKSNRVDLLVKDSKERLIIVEIQNTRELDYFYKILYNTSKAITEHIREGEPYVRVKKVITVSVVYFDLGQGEDYVYYGSTDFKGIHKRDSLELSETQKKMFQRQTLASTYPEHYIIKVNEFDDVARDSLDEWIYFLKNSEIKEEFKAKGLTEAREKLKEIDLSPAELPSYKRYLEDLRYDASIAATIKFDTEFARASGREEGREKGREEGLKEGMEKGKLEEKIEIARKLKNQGVDIDIICEASGLSKQEIAKL